MNTDDANLFKVLPVYQLGPENWERLAWELGRTDERKIRWALELLPFAWSKLIEPEQGW